MGLREGGRGRQGGLVGSHGSRAGAGQILQGLDFYVTAARSLHLKKTNRNPVLVAASVFSPGGQITKTVPSEGSWVIHVTPIYLRTVN